MKKRRVLNFCILLAIIGVLAVASCAAPAPAPTPAPAPAPAPSPAPAPTPAPSPAPAPAPAQPPEVMTWQVQTSDPSGSLVYSQIDEMVKSLAALTEGRLVLELFPGGSIVPAFEEPDAIDKGILDAAFTSPFFGRHIGGPSSGLFQVRGGGMTPIPHYLWLNVGGGFELQDRAFANSNIMFPKWTGMVTTAEVFMHSSKVIEDLGDLQKLKMRTAGDPGIILKNMGVSTMVIPFGEIYESMERGVIDAFEILGPAQNWDLGAQEIADYMYLSPLRYPSGFYHMYVNRDSFAELPADLKSALIEVSKAAGINCYGVMVAEDIVAMKKFSDYGVNVLRLPAEIEEEFMKKADEFYDEESAKDPFYAEVIESQRAFEKAYKTLF